MNEPRLPHPFLSALGAIVLVAVAAASGVGAISMLGNLHARSLAAADAALQVPKPFSLGEKQLIAKAAIVYDPSTQTVLFAKNATALLPLASLTKLATATTILDTIHEDPLITITDADILPGGSEADWNFAKGDSITLSNLLKMALVASSNDAMQAAASSLGPQYRAAMRDDLRRLGLTDMEFNNPTGLDVDSSTAGGYGSAHDMAVLAGYFARTYPQYFNLTTQPSISIPTNGAVLTAEATAIPIQNLPGLIGAKTGYTDLAGGNLVAVFDVDVGHPLVAVVLGSTIDGRFTDMQTLIQAAQAQ